MQRFLSVLFCLSSVAICSTARAQHRSDVQDRFEAQDRFELYATLNVTHASPVPSSVVLTAGTYQTQYTGLTLVGLGGGATINLLRRPALSVGLDIHGSTHHGVAASNAVESGLYGVKAATPLRNPRFKPWIEGAAGLLDAHTPNVSSPGANAQASSPSFASHFAVITGTAGLDYGIARHFDLRLFDVTGGTSFGATPGISMWAVNTGVAVHF